MTAADPVVVKVGGARAVDPKGVLADVAAVRDDGTDVVVVHGGSTAVDDALGIDRAGAADLHDDGHTDHRRCCPSPDPRVAGLEGAARSEKAGEASTAGVGEQREPATKRTASRAADRREAAE